VCIYVILKRIMFDCSDPAVLGCVCRCVYDLGMFVER